MAMAGKLAVVGAFILRLTGTWQFHLHAGMWLHVLSWWGRSPPRRGNVSSAATWQYHSYAEA